jgi:hypothetical protein
MKRESQDQEWYLLVELGSLCITTRPLDRSSEMSPLKTSGLRSRWYALENRRCKGHPGRAALSSFRGGCR